MKWRWGTIFTRTKSKKSREKRLVLALKPWREDDDEHGYTTEGYYKPQWPGC